MLYRVEVSTKSGFSDARGESLRRQVAALGVAGIQAISVSDLYFLDGALDDSTVRHLSDTLLHDPVVEEAVALRMDRDETNRMGAEDAESLPDSLRAPRLCGEDVQVVEVALLPGVTDSVAESLLASAKTIGVTGLARAATGHRYVFTGDIDSAVLPRIAEGLLANVVIQSYTIDRPIAPPFVPPAAVDETVEVIPLVGADDAGLLAISRERRLSLDLAEMQAIRRYYAGEGREPTDIELEMLAQTWSEHCIHKTFRALIEYEELHPDGRPITGSQRTIDSLLKTCIRAATEKVNKPWVRSAFVDNAGIVAFDDDFDLAFKVETHNHPSALEPFGGANTGVGGVIRDVIGVSARPIANTDVLCFGPADLPLDALPAGVLHPRRIADGVTAGIEDYGNKMGIPTVNGAILYDERYTANPLVFCGCLGLLPRGSHRNQPQPGDLVVVIGGSTGRDGLRGATFSSMEMDHQTGQIAGSAVQIGHPIHEKQALEAVLLARDAGLYTAITDCGAGGLSSAIGEMASALGAEIELASVPLKYAGLRPWEIWLSEAQERMVLAVPPANWLQVNAICDGLDASATVLGRFTGDGRLTLRCAGRLVGELSADFLHNGIPRRRLKAVWTRPERNCTAEPQRTQRISVPSASPLSAPLWWDSAHGNKRLLALLASPDIRSKEDVVRRYDHEVQGATVVKPFVGRAAAGPSDAAVLDLRFATGHASQAGQGVALSVGINPHIGDSDPYAMAWAAVDEAMRNCVAVGADPDRIALLDNFCWGNPTLPDRLGSLVRCAEGCYDAAVAYGAPFVSGKDSLNNEYVGADGKKHAIPGTLLISALGIVPDVSRTVTSDLKAVGDRLYLAGGPHPPAPSPELRSLQLRRGGEAVGADFPPLQLTGAPTVGEAVGADFPPLPMTGAPTMGEAVGADFPPLPMTGVWSSGEGGQGGEGRLALYRALHRAIRAGLVRACHDLSEGGLAVAIAEMALGGGLGAELRLGAAPHPSASFAQPQTARSTQDSAVQPVSLDQMLLFSESLGRLLVEVRSEDAARFEACLAGLPCAHVGEVTADGRLRILGTTGATVIEVEIAAVEDAWRGHIR